MAYGKLFLIPVPIAEDALHTIPTYVIEQIHELKHFIAERAKTARHFIKATQPPYAIQELTIFELDKHNKDQPKEPFLQPALEGHAIGLLSEAGCPAVADPGAKIVLLAHQLGIEVVPMVGPSSILLALMASGMDGQQFCFNGYLSVKKQQLAKELKKLEQLSSKLQQTQLFMEAPYRNNNILDEALKHLSPSTLFGIACELTGKNAFTKTLAVQEWNKTQKPDLHKRPTIFSILKKS